MNVFYTKITKSKQFFQFLYESDDIIINNKSVPIDDNTDSMQDCVVECNNLENLKNTLAKTYKIKLESSVGLSFCVFPFKAILLFV